jgi:geranylgeranyl diphosphate synthase type 3
MILQKILQPVTYLKQVPGKQFLSRIPYAYNYWLKVPADKLIVLKEIDDIIHHSGML